MNIFWKGAAVSKIVNILAVCEHFLEGSYTVFMLANILGVCEHFLEGAAVSNLVNIFSSL